MAGYALLAGDEIRLGDVIAGDVHLTGRVLTFAEGARVEGQLFIYEDTIGSLEVPESVAPATRIERRSTDEWDRGPASMGPTPWADLRNTFLTGVLTVAVLAILAAASIPQTLADLRRNLRERPLRNLWIGFLARSVVGILLIPGSVIVALVVGFVGYVVAAYTLGIGVLAVFGRGHPTTLRSRAIAAGTGALLVDLTGLIRFLGGVFVLALVLAGGSARSR